MDNSYINKKDFITLDGFKHVRYLPQCLNEEESLKRSEKFYKFLDLRRSVRDFSSKKVDRQIIENIIKTAGTAPSGANKQPYTFCVVENIELKKKIRIAAEKEEEKSYNERMSASWLADLKHLGTNAQKPFLEIAPYLIVVFKRPYEIDEQGEKHQNYYVNESTGLACGMLINAIHQAGLVTLTHTPSPMRFLEKILNRPENERAFLLLPVGYAADKTYVPDINRKELNKLMKWYD